MVFNETNKQGQPLKLWNLDTFFSMCRLWLTHYCWDNLQHNSALYLNAGIKSYSNIFPDDAT